MLQISVEERQEILRTFVRECHVPERKREGVFKTINELADLYEGSDSNVIGVLWRAMERGTEEFDKYAKKLQNYYKSKVAKIPANARSLVSGQDIATLEMLLQREEQIARGERVAKDRMFLPKYAQEMSKYPDAIRMELFFMDCYKEMGVKPEQ